jgi:Uma2 family endonuclease
MNAALSLSELKPHKISTALLKSFMESGAFDGLPRMELLDGTLYEMSPQKSPHVLAKNRLTFRLQAKILELSLPFEALSEPTIAIGETSAPEPDIIICNAPETEGFYPAACVMLAVEVSLTSLQTDLGYKKALYASADIPEYWVVDVNAGLFHIFWNPSGETYQETSIVAIGGMISSKTIAGLSVETLGLI